MTGKIKKFGSLFIDVDFKIVEGLRKEFYKTKKPGFEIERPLRFEHITIVPSYIQLPNKGFEGLDAEFTISPGFYRNERALWVLVKCPLAERIRQVYNLKNQLPLHICIGYFKKPQEETIQF